MSQQFDYQNSLADLWLCGLETGMVNSGQALEMVRRAPASLWALLVAFIPYLKDEELETARQLAIRLERQTNCLHALAVLSVRLPARECQELQNEIVATAFEQDNAYERVRAIGRIAPFLTPGGQKTAALRQGLLQALDLPARDSWSQTSPRAEELIRLLPVLPEQAAVQAALAALQALMAFGEISYGKDKAGYRAQWLARLAVEAPAARAQALRQLFDVIQEAQHGAAPGEIDPRVSAIKIIAPHLEGELLAEALQAAAAIPPTYVRVQALACLAPWLEDSQTVRVLSQTGELLEEIGGGDRWVEAAAALAPQLEEGRRAALFEYILADIDRQKEELLRYNSLLHLAKCLPDQGAWGERAWQATKKISNDFQRLKIRAALVLCLPSARQLTALRQVLEAINRLDGWYLKSVILDELVQAGRKELLAKELLAKELLAEILDSLQCT